MMYLSQNIIGNIIPHEFYHQITTKSGRPDLTTMSILSEIVYWYRPKQIIDNSTGLKRAVAKFLGDSWQTSYSHFQKKFNFSHETIRRSLVKLERLGIIKRIFRTVLLRGQEYNNVLFIQLNSQPDSKASFFNSNHANSKFLAPHNVAPSPQIVGDNYIDIENKKEYKENRSMAEAKSNFLKNFSSKFLQENDTQLNNLTDCSQIPNLQNNRQIHNLKDFYPLSEEDCNKLQILSGRDFSLRAMNEILLDMSQRLKDKWFKRKKNFLSYMSKAFKYEMRDAVKVSNETFRIKNNLKIEDEFLQKEIEQDLEVKRQEAYLTELEYSLQVSPEWHLKKKLASTLERSKAYNLLTSYTSSRLEEGKFTITLRKHIDLSELDQKIILDQVKATQENMSFADFQFQIVDRLEIVMPEKENDQQLALGLKENYIGKGGCQGDIKLQASSRQFNSIWSKIRQQISSYYGDKGQGIDKNWFSKLEPEVDEGEKLIKLKAPSNFIRDWVSREYGQTIERILKSEQYNCLIC